MVLFSCQKKFKIVMQPMYVSFSKLAALHEYSSGLSLRVDLRILNTREYSAGTKLKSLVRWLPGSVIMT